MKLDYIIWENIIIKSFWKRRYDRNWVLFLLFTSPNDRILVKEFLYLLLARKKSCFLQLKLKIKSLVVAIIYFSDFSESETHFFFHISSKKTS